MEEHRARLRCGFSLRPGFRSDDARHLSRHLWAGSKVALQGSGRCWIHYEVWLSVTGQSSAGLHAAVTLEPEQLELRMISG